MKKGQKVTFLATNGRSTKPMVRRGEVTVITGNKVIIASQGKVFSRQVNQVIEVTS